MALLTDSLSVWKIGFRWADLDPDRLWLRLPLHVRDNFSLVMEAILSGEILCETLTLAKRPHDSKADPKYYIRTYIDDVYSCIYGQSYNRKLLKWATIERIEFMNWCEARSIPLPEFWFPPGWKLNFEPPEDGTLAMWAEHVEPDDDEIVHISYRDYPGIANNKEQSIASTLTDTQKELRINQKIHITCCQIALEIWREEPTRPVISVVQDEKIQKYGGASHYEKDTVRRWLNEIAPPEVKSRRGRPPKNKDQGE